MRFGFAVKVIGHGGNLATIPADAGMPSNDARRWQTGPHVRTSIEYVSEIFHYLHKTDIHMYRMSSDFVPYLTHPDMPQFHGQLEEAKDELAELGALARSYDIRLSLHPSQYILLNALDKEVARKSIVDLNAQSKLLDVMGCGPEAVVVTHVGGVYGDRDESKAAVYSALPRSCRKKPSGVWCWKTTTFRTACLMSCRSTKRPVFPSSSTTCTISASIPRAWP